MNPRLFASDTIFSIPLEVGSSRFRVVDIVDTFLDIFTDCKRSFLYESSETSNGIHRYIIVLVHFLSLLRSTFYALCTMHYALCTMHYVLVSSNYHRLRRTESGIIGETGRDIRRRARNRGTRVVGTRESDVFENDWLCSDLARRRRQSYGDCHLPRGRPVHPHAGVYVADKPREQAVALVERNFLRQRRIHCGPERTDIIGKNCRELCVLYRARCIRHGEKYRVCRFLSGLRRQGSRNTERIVEIGRASCRERG